ncbi:hypothetical protein [Deinococcus marmoris]|uniref:hypothetical protein n=1 Tax=Deinococcus marmoris TaxID=249408 RepID=UPI00049548D2|nr:hypothetical protein [Deinococcus marmoris]
MSLEREDALFVLTDDMLVYQDGGGTRRVTLRDLTRIHSDQAGLLRVETPAGTALTASLLGFDVGQVQSFFKGVRSATARAKDLPDSPTPALGGAKTFGSAPAADLGAAGSGEARAQDGESRGGQPEETASEVAGMPKPAGTQQEKAQPDESASASEAEAEEGGATGEAGSPLTFSAAPAQEDAAAARPPAAPAASGGQNVKDLELRKSGGSAENPVVISSSSFSPNVSKPGLGAGGGGVGARAEASKTETSKTEIFRPEPVKPEAMKPELRKSQTSAPPPAAPPDHQF